MAEHAGAAMRRRQRRLRQWIRHERPSVAMALSEKKHHTSRGHRKDRAGGEARDVLHGHVPEAPLPQGRVLRHVLGHLPVPALDVPVPQMVDQLPDIVQFFRALSPDPEQVIEVPKILPDDVKVDSGSGSRLFGALLSPEKYRICTVWVMTSGWLISVFSVHARQWIHARASNYRVFFSLMSFTHFQREGGDEDSRHAMAGVRGRIFRAVRTGTRPRGSCPQGHGFVN